jgi:hypothetical protein
MTALDRYFIKSDDGDLVMVTENDGHAFIKSGPERREEVIKPGHKYYEIGLKRCLADE